MTTIDLAKRLAACKRWHLMQSMPCLDKDGLKWIPIKRSRHPSSKGQLWTCSDMHGQASYGFYESELIPNLTDPATVGCLLYMLRDATGEEMCDVIDLVMGHWYTEDTFETALCQALLHVWGEG